MYVERVPNRNSRPAILLREGWREDGKVRKRTLANLSHWPPAKIETLRRLLRDETDAAQRRESPLKPATRSESAETKASVKKTAEGVTIHRFRGLLAHLATLTKNTIQPTGDLPEFDQLTIPTALQKKAFDLLEVRVPV